MGSLLMHIGVSEIVRKRLNLSTKFIYGSILPDLIKKETGDRTGTHFIKTVVTDKGIQRLPEIDRAISMLNGKMDKEVRLGYIAHLIEDYIWFEKYIPSFAIYIENERLVYLKDNSIHSGDEFSKEMYEDYIKINTHIKKQWIDNYDFFKSDMKKILTPKELDFLESNEEENTQEPNDTFNILTKESIDRYIKETVEKVEKTIKELMGE